MTTEANIWAAIMGSSLLFFAAGYCYDTGTLVEHHACRSIRLLSVFFVLLVVGFLGLVFCE